MITIGICDDEEMHRRGIREVCEQYFTENELEHEFVEFASGEDVLNCNVLKKIHLLFLDVELGGVDGLAVLKYVEEAEWVWRVVFVTSHAEAVWDSFGIKTLGFERKPIIPEKIMKWIQVAIHENRENVVFDFITTGGIMYKSVEDIYYLKAEGNYTYLHTRSERWFINDKLKLWEEKMKQTSMVRIHKSYLINMAHVRKWETNNVSLENGETFSVGRQYAKKAKETYYNYVREQAMRRVTNQW